MGKGGPEIVNTIGCADCHDTASKEFRKGNPPPASPVPYADRAMTAIGKPFRSRDASISSLRCAASAVEYYFSGPGGEIPWDKGTTVEQMEEYYDELALPTGHALSRPHAQSPASGTRPGAPAFTAEQRRLRRLPHAKGAERAGQRSTLDQR